jgi:hypothetical protein
MTQGVLATERNAARVRPQRGIAEYGVTVGGVHALAGGTQIIRLWALYPATAAAEPYARAGLPLSSICCSAITGPGFFALRFGLPGRTGEGAPG